MAKARSIAASSKTKPGAHSPVRVGPKSKTGDPACSEAMSMWVRARHAGIKAASSVFATLGKCRSMARQMKQAQSAENKGATLRAQVIRHRLSKGVEGPITQKDRAAAAKAKRGELEQRRAERAGRKAESRPSLREQADAHRRGQGLAANDRASLAWRIRQAKSETRDRLEIASKATGKSLEYQRQRLADEAASARAAADYWSKRPEAFGADRTARLERAKAKIAERALKNAPKPTKQEYEPSPLEIQIARRVNRNAMMAEARSEAAREAREIRAKGDSGKRWRERLKEVQGKLDDSPTVRDRAALMARRGVIKQAAREAMATPSAEAIREERAKGGAKPAKGSMAEALQAQLRKHEAEMAVDRAKSAADLSKMSPKERMAEIRRRRGDTPELRMERAEELRARLRRGTSGDADARIASLKSDIAKTSVNQPSRKANFRADVLAIRRVQRAEKSVVLPSLSGSEKQIKWAKDIRSAHIQQIAKIEARLKGGVPASYTDAQKAQHAELKDALNWVKSQSSSRYWIDNRHSDLQTLVEQRVRDAKKAKR